MNQYERQTLTVNGAKVVMLTAGSGEPLLFLHGAGTVTGSDFGLPWADKYRVLMPFHPGFGESGDAPHLADIHDYVMHYVDLLDELKLDKVNLVGFSMGGLLAARLASQYPNRVKKLVLVAPAGLRDDKHPMADIFSMPPEVLMASLANDFNVVARHLPKEVTPDFIGERYRESSTAAKLIWERPYDPKLPRGAHRLKMPVLVVWGEDDKIVPVQQTETWHHMLPHAEIKIFKGAGHLVLDEKPEAVQAVADFLG
jgi:pimeloyl-ACP methyl ester carboxylesterase